MRTIISDNFGNSVIVSHFGISTGDKSGFYTLKAYGTRSRRVRDDEGNTSIESDDVSVYIRNLSTDKAQALEAARAYVAEHYPTDRLNQQVNFDLDEIERISREQADARRAAEAARVAATDFNVFQIGKHAGKTVEAVYAEDKGYLEWFCGQSYRAETDAARTQAFAKALLAPEQELAAKAANSKLLALKQEIGKPTLIEWYNGNNGQFCQSIVHGFGAGKVPTGRGLQIVLEIIAKCVGRKGSKAFNARLAELEAKFN